MDGSSIFSTFVGYMGIYSVVCLIFNLFNRHTVNFIRDADDKHSNIEGKKWPLTKQK
jgi:hypothetical protein